MEELISNQHIHTRYSDGASNHAEIAQIALDTGLDVLIVTDHNVLVKGLDRHYTAKGRKLLLLVGEEVHDRLRDKEGNHLLIFGHQLEMTGFANDPRQLIEKATRDGGLTFIAHPDEEAMPSFHEPSYTWDDWDVSGYTGLEIWNGLSELKSVAHSRVEAFFYAYFPEFIATSPHPKTMKKWDDLLNEGRMIVAVGGSDSHALNIRMGPFRRVIFPYHYHFSAVNNHLLVPNGLTGNLDSDRAMVFDALRQGHSFVGYDIPAPTRGFRFIAQGKDKTAIMGDEINLFGSVTLQIRLPFPAEFSLFKNGKVINAPGKRNSFTQVVTEPGIYRVECYIDYLGKRRTWIVSNPIYVRKTETPPRRVN
jgi:hypothetical protein